MPRAVSLRDGQTADVPVGRAGGLPRLPVGTPWPVSPGGPLPFLASFDCAALPKVDGLALPPDGSLLVFLHHENEEDDGSLSDFQQRLARDLPHRKDLHALAGRLWPNATYAAFHFGGYTSSTSELYTGDLYTTPELSMAVESLEARQKAGGPVVPPEQEDFRLEEELHRVMREWVPLIQFEPGDDVYSAGS